MGTQENLERGNAKQTNFFYEGITKQLEKNRDEIETCLTEIADGLKNVNYVLTYKQFQIMGQLSYLMGIDFISQAYLKHDTMDNVVTRFNKSKISSVIVNSYLNIIIKIKEKHIVDGKEKMKASITKAIVIPTEEKLKFKEMTLLVDKIVKNSILPVTMVKDISEIVKVFKKNPVQNDILRVNGLISQNCKFAGSHAIKNMIKLYGVDSMFVDAIDKAKKAYDEQKFAVVYFDSILSVNEAMQRLEKAPIIGCFEDIEKVDFEFLKKEYEAGEESKEVVETKKALSDKKDFENIPELADLPDYKELSEEETDKMFDDNITEFVTHMYYEYTGKVIEDPEIVVKVVTEMLTESDRAQSFYGLLKGKLLSLGEDVEYNGKVDPIALHEIFSKKADELRETVKENSEIVFKEIDENIQPKLVNYVNACINDLVLADEQQKQFMVSQLLENQINTYYQLIEMLNLIENSEILGSGLYSYVVLYDFIEETMELKEIIELNLKNQEDVQKISFFAAFAEYYGQFLPKKESDIETKEEKE